MLQHFFLQTELSVVYFTVGKCDKVPLYVLNQAFLAIARITKLGWFDAGQQDIIAQVKQVMGLRSEAHVILGLSIYAALVQEVSTYQRRGKALSLARHTRVSSRFKDTALLEIVCTALAAVAPGASEGVARAALKLVLAGLTYNFMTSYADDASDDIATVQIPLSWRETVESPAFLETFFRAYSAYGPPVSSTALECVAVVSSVRRSLFTSDDARVRFLTALMGGVQAIVESNGGASLTRPENHHMLARLLARMKANYQLSQLAGLPGWERWIGCVYNFSVASLRAWAALENSVYYIMCFWSRMVVSLTYLPTKAPPTYVDVYAPKIAEAYIRTRFDSVEYALAGKIDDDYLASEDVMAEQLEYIPQIARCSYAATGAFLTAYMDPLLATLRNAFQQNQQQGGGSGSGSGSETPEMVVLMGRAAWFVYLVGSFIKARVVSTNTEETDLIDGELISRVLLLMRITDERTTSSSSSNSSSSGGGGGVGGCDYDSDAWTKLELAYCYFWLNFRRVYINEANNMNTTSKMFAKLSEYLGLNGMTAILDVVFNKIGNNLLAHRRNPRVIERTLELFHELSTGYSSQHLVARLGVVAQILDNHAAVFGPATWANVRDDARHCTMFYRTLGRLLLTEEHAARFPAFMAPIGAAFDLFVAQPSKEAVLAQPQLRAAALCALHQLRGLFESCVSASQYTRYFEWFHPRYTLVLVFLAELYGHSGSNNGGEYRFDDDRGMFFTALMKFVLELSWNKSSRIKFDFVSANGIILFKEVCSPLLISFGSTIAANTSLAWANESRSKSGIIISSSGSSSSNSSSNNSSKACDPLKSACEELYKSIRLCVKIFTNVLLGGYVNLGVFTLYKDTCFTDALSVVLRVALSIPVDDLIGYEKLGLPVFAFLDAVASVYPVAFLRLLPQDLFGALLLYLGEGLTRSSVSQVVSYSCTVLDYIFSAYVDRKRRLVALLSGNGGKVPAPAFIPAIAAQNEELAASVASFEQNMSLLPDVIPRFLYALFCVILFTDCQYSYTAAKAIFSLTFAAPAKFAEAKAAMLQAQPPAPQQKLLEAFAKLEASVDLAAAAAALTVQPQAQPQQQQQPQAMGRTGRLTEKDKFTQALVVFVHDVKLIPGLVPIIP